LKKRDRFKGSSAQCIAVRYVWTNVLYAGEPGKIRTAIPTGYEVSMKQTDRTEPTRDDLVTS
jgi:hypothetical protein